MRNILKGTLKIKKLGLNEKIFLYAYAIFIIVDIVDDSLYSIHLLWQIITILDMVGLSILLLSRKKLKNYQIALLFVIFMCFSIAGFSTGREYIILFALFLMNADVVSFEKIVQCSKITSMVTVSFIIISCLLNILPDYTFTRGVRKAYSLGFQYYSYIPFVMLYIMVMDMFIKYEKKKLELFRIIFWGAIQYVIFYLSTVRLTFYLSILALIIYAIFVFIKKIDLNRCLIKLLSIVAFPLGGILCGYIMYHYDSTNIYHALLNRLLNDRLYLSYIGAKRYPVRLFGQEIITNTLKDGKVVENNFFYIDSGFVYSILGYGLIFTILVICLYTCILHYACEKNNKMLFLWTIVVLIFTFVNNTWISLTYNPLLFVLSFLIKEKLNKMEYLNNNI